MTITTRCERGTWNVKVRVRKWRRKEKENRVEDLYWKQSLLRLAHSAFFWTTITRKSAALALERYDYLKLNQPFNRDVRDGALPGLGWYCRCETHPNYYIKRWDALAIYFPRVIRGAESNSLAPLTTTWKSSSPLKRPNQASGDKNREGDSSIT